MLRLYAVINICLIFFSVIYPLLWYFGQKYVGVTPIAILMAAVWLIRSCFAKTLYQRLVSFTIALIFVLLAVIGSASAMYWYPVMVSMLMLFIFAGSLFSRQSVIERLARLHNKDLPLSGIRYTRHVTEIWCGFFILNILITTALILSECWQAWTIYTGIVAYILMGVLFAGEFLYRQFILKKKYDVC